MTRIMSDTNELDGPEHGPADGGAPDRLIVFLHGLGANGQDLIGLAPVLAQIFPRAQFLAPDAPHPCDMAPVGYQWFSLQEMERPQLQAGVESVTPLLDRYLDRQMERFDLPPERVAVVGFSQGTMLSLYALPRRDKPLAGLVGYSGMLISPESLADTLSSRLPVLLVHGNDDPVVPPEMTKYAKEALDLAGFDVEAHYIEGLAHSIDETGLRLGVQFLMSAFGDAGPETRAPAND